MFHMPLSFMWVPLIAYACLVGAWYVSNRYFDYEEDRISQGPEANGGKELLTISIVAFLVGLLLLITARSPVLPYLIFALLMLLYSCPISLFGKKRKLKQLLIVKNVYAAGLWHLTYASVLYFYTPLSLHTNFFLIYRSTFPFFLIMFMFEVLWNIRDMKGDKVVGTHTIPNTFPPIVAQIVMGVSLAIAAWCMCSYRVNIFVLGEFVFLFGLLFLASPKRSRWFFHSAIYVLCLFNITLALTL